jgi:hypothetical protein
LDEWLKAPGDKTLGSLIEVFGEKSFAIIFLLLMALPALPLPTGGLTHVTELITMLVSLELIAGRKTIWLPERWKRIDVGKLMKGKAARTLTGFIARVERYSKQRGNRVLVRNPVPSFIGFIVFVFTLAAFVAPPFSGLDTLPALGVVIISLALLLEDALVLLVGIIIGCAGIALELVLGTALYEGARHFF